MFIEVIDKSDGKEILLNVDSIIGIEPRINSSMISVSLITETKIIETYQSYEAVKKLLKKARAF